MTYTSYSSVTCVQTCSLPISAGSCPRSSKGHPERPHVAPRSALLRRSSRHRLPGTRRRISGRSGERRCGSDRGRDAKDPTSRRRDRPSRHGRKNDVEGKRESRRVEQGGRRDKKKKKKQ